LLIPILLCSDAYDNLAEVASLEHPDEGLGRFLQTVDDFFTIADATVRDAGTDLAQEFGGRKSVNLGLPRGRAARTFVGP
jgi:hypothetical protein